MMKELEKNYNPQGFESKIYKFWTDNGYFAASVDPTKKPYTIVIPPPNITGQLHMGHALDNTLQDILIRYKRMQGFSALWVPGTDHASIATEAKIVEAMKKEGISKDDIGRDEFLKRAWEWKKEYGGRIIRQLKRLGSSCDWSRERFTLDEGCSKAVDEVFVKLYEKGLIYRGKRIINWCPHCKTSISDAEVEYEEQDGSFWHLRYELSDKSGFLELATTRPETLLGDTAVAVNPNDERYKSLIGKKVFLPLCDREIEIIADDYVDIDFGTGVVKITPAHDPNDFEVGLRHNLPIINVMNESAIMNENAGVYQGLDRYECRKNIVADLEKGGYLVKTEPHSHNVGTCYRCKTTVEPRVSLQWFVKMQPLAAPAIEAVKNGQTKFIPERFDKIYFHWMENIKDWCISRQLWWGHRIPAYYCADCGKTTVSKVAPTTCTHCNSKNLKQDDDTLDTWFSSALWPFSTLGWPDKTADFDYFYPTNTLVTGYDIIFFWVARMIFSAIEQTGKAPFDTVFLHGLVRDSQGRKMSKSLGNGIDPLEIIDEYGADALRLALVSNNSPGNDMRYSEEKIKSSRNFANKLWNATRFILMNLSDDVKTIELPEKLATEDKWILSQYNNLVKEVTENIDKFELGIAVSKLYDFIWDIMCDWYIELCKPRLQHGGESSLNAQKVLVYVMTNTLKLLHPFMPFITEEIWQALPNDSDSIMTAQWPVFKEELCFTKEETDFAMIIDAIKGIRNVRTSMNVVSSKKASIYIQTEFVDIFTSSVDFFKRLASANDVYVSDKALIDDGVQVVTQCAKILIPLDELVDKQKELARLTHEKEVCLMDIAALDAKASNENFTSKAPKNVVDAIKIKLAKAQELLNKINDSIDAL
ncbi:MAG: valine--tRNA ligase [Oscillospiraceae bacterium]